MKNTRSLSNEHPDGNRPGGFFFLLLKYFDYDGHAEHDVNEENQTTATKKYRLRTMRISIFFSFFTFICKRTTSAYRGNDKFKFNQSKLTRKKDKKKKRRHTVVQHNIINGRICARR